MPFCADPIPLWQFIQMTPAQRRANAGRIIDCNAVEPPTTIPCDYEIIDAKPAHEWGE